MLRSLLLGAALASAAAAASAQPRPSSTQEIVSATQDCASAAQVEGVAEDRLTAAGWAKGSMSREGQPIATALSFYGKGGSNSVIMTMMDGNKAGRLCSVTAVLKSTGDYQKLVDAIVKLENTRAVKKEGLEITFLSGTHVIQSALTGSRDKPSVRIAVMAISPEKK